MFAVRQGAGEAEWRKTSVHYTPCSKREHLVRIDCHYSVSLYDKKPSEVAFPKRRKTMCFCMPVPCQSPRQTSLWPLRATQFMFLCRSLCDQSVIPRLETGTCYFPWKTWEMRENNSWGLCSVRKASLRSCVTPCVLRGPAASTSPLLEKQTNTSHSSPTEPTSSLWGRSRSRGWENFRAPLCCGLQNPLDEVSDRKVQYMVPMKR